MKQSFPLLFRAQQQTPTSPRPLGQDRHCSRHLIRSGGVADAAVVVDPLEDLGMPDQAVLRLPHPVVLVGEVEEPAGHAPGLQQVEEQDALADGQPEVQVAVHDEVRRRPAVDEEQRVPVVVGRAGPEPGLVERPAEVAVHEPELLAGVLVQRRGAAVVRDERLEPAAELVALDPAGTGQLSVEPAPRG